jgi:hypothetical protein
MPEILATLPTKCAHPLGLGLRYIPNSALDMQVRLRRKHVLPRYDKHVVELVRLAKVWLEHTRRNQAESILGQLERATKAADESRFLEVLERIDWRNRPAGDFLRAIRLALETGAHLAARQISDTAIHSYPTNAELQRFARALAPPRLISSSLPLDETGNANRKWLQDHSGEYKGRWVAIKRGELLGVADSLPELTANLGHTTDDALLTIAP